MPAMLGFCEYPSWLMYLYTKGHTKEIHAMKSGGKSVRWRGEGMTRRMCPLYS
jgi:hypothetical protein